MKTSIAYNKCDGELSTPFQPGGTMILSLNESAHRAIEAGADNTGLGRWSWIRYRGKHNVVLQVICAYCPCKPTDPGEKTTHSQQQRYFDNHNDPRSPHDALLEDLGSYILAVQEAGDQIVLLMDCNEDVCGARIRAQLEENSLFDCVLDKHGGVNAPPTYNRGSRPIDAIFKIITIQVTECGYLPFGHFPFVDIRIV